MGVRGQPQARTALLRERTPVPSEQEAVCALHPVGTFRRREKCLSPAGIRTAGRPSRGFATLPNTLSQLSLLLSVSRLSYLLPTTHTPPQHAHNHTPHTVIRRSLNAELSTALQNGLPCRSPCAQCRPLYSEEYRDDAGIL
jgi:hypothetical protein